VTPTASASTRAPEIRALSGIRVVAPGRPGASIFDVAGNPEMTVGTFLSNLALVHAWNIHDKLTWNAPAWFVSVEAFRTWRFPPSSRWRALGSAGGRSRSAWRARRCSSRSR